MAAYVTLGFLSLLWGSSFVLIKIASAAFAPLPFALARVSVAAVAMLTTSVLMGLRWPGRRPGLWVTLAGLALVGQVIPFLLFGYAARMTTSADMALMIGAQPIFVFLGGRFLGSGDRWTLPGALGLAIGFAGVGVALWAPGHAAATVPHAGLGRTLALAATFCYAMSTILSGAATREIGAVRSVTASMTLSALSLGLVSPAFGGARLIETVVSAPAVSLAAMLALGIFNTALAYYVYFRLVADDGPTFASLNNYIVPVIGVVGGGLVLHEPIAGSAWAGLALVLLGVALTGRSVRLR